MELQEKFNDYRMHTLNKEKEFHKIIEKLYTDKTYIHDETKSIDELYHRILENFDLANDKTNSYLEGKYQQS